MRKKKLVNPGLDSLRAELKRVRYRQRYNSVVRSTIYILLTVAAAAVLVATLLLPVLRIYGSSMTPSLYEGDIVVSLKTTDFERGDIISFYYNNKILVKRVIAFEGEWVNIDEEGNVYVDGQQLDEPYIDEKALGECDIKLPYQVPDGRLFVMGDHRATSADSRSTTVGCVMEEQIVGRIVYRVWPMSEFGPVE
ncbi:MAG: signal peptidase I [Clostridiales bacterium]|nr:signal peptidase I [Clostridiales bacterium]